MKCSDVWGIRDTDGSSMNEDVHQSFRPERDLSLA